MHGQARIRIRGLRAGGEPAGHTERHTRGDVDFGRAVLDARAGRRGGATKLRLPPSLAATATGSSSFFWLGRLRVTQKAKAACLLLLGLASPRVC